MAHTVVLKKPKDEPEETSMAEFALILPIAAIVQFFVNLPFDAAGHWITAIVLVLAGFAAFCMAAATPSQH